MFPAFISDTSNREFPPGSLKHRDIYVISYAYVPVFCFLCDTISPSANIAESLFSVCVKI